MNWKSLLKWSLVILIFAFLFRYLYLTWGDLQDYTFTLNYELFALSYVFIFAHLIFVALGWGLMLRALRKPGLPLLQAIKIRTISDFGRFLPGKVWLVLGRIHYCKKYKIPSDVVTFSTLLEIFVNIVAAAIVFVLVFLVFVQGSLSEYALYVLLLLPIPLFLMHPRFFHPFMKLAAKLLKKSYVKAHVKFHYILSLLSVFIVAWFFLGVGFYLMVNSIYPIGIELLFPFTGIITIAWVLGFVMIFLPAGLGFREAVLTYLLSFYLPVPIAILISVVARVWLLIGEILTALLFLLVKTKK